MNFYSAKLPFHFSEKRLAQDLKNCESLVFSDHYNTADYSGEWKIIALRSMDGDPNNIRAFSLTGEYENTPLLDSCPYFRELIDVFECEKESIRLLNLTPGSKIHEHTDHNLGYEDGIFRIHIPISTNSDVHFYINDERLRMEVGDCWYGNFNLPHKVENNGKKDRVHLVIDCKRNAWSDTLFAKLGYDFTKESEPNQYSEETRQMIIDELKRHNTVVSQELIEKLSKDQKGGS